MILMYNSLKLEVLCQVELSILYCNGEEGLIFCWQLFVKSMRFSKLLLDSLSSFLSTKRYWWLVGRFDSYSWCTSFNVKLLLDKRVVEEMWKSLRACWLCSVGLWGIIQFEFWIRICYALFLWCSNWSQFIGSFCRSKSCHQFS